MRGHTVVAVVLAAIALVANLADLLFLDFFGPIVALLWAVGRFSGVDGRVLRPATVAALP